MATATNPSIIVVLIHGGPLDVAWMEASDRIDAILTAWFPGQVSIDMLQCNRPAGQPLAGPLHSSACLSLQLDLPATQVTVVESQL